MRRVRWLLSVASAMVMAACVIHRLDVEPIDAETTGPVSVGSPVKAHLKDGATVVFEQGVSIENSVLTGNGRKFDLSLTSSTTVTSIPLEDIAAMESFATPVAEAATGFASTGVMLGAIIGGAALAKAIFGSCPTVYSLDTPAGPVLEAESFSYSIAPLLEARDVDRLGLVDESGSGGIVRLEVRNEALETHYLNHFELIEVAHAAGESVYPDPQGRPVIVGGSVAPVLATDAANREITSSVAAADERVWTSDDAVIEAATVASYRDHIILEFELPGAPDRLALLLRLRNSLLNTVLFYDMMLEGQGLKALDWLGNDLNQLGPALELGRWYAEKMGMRVELWDGEQFVEVARIPDQGPIAWKDLAVTISAPTEGEVRIRLSFVAGNWLIDAAAVAIEVRPATPRYVQLTSVLAPGSEVLNDARERLGAPDDRYFVTRPGDSIGLRFDVGQAVEGMRRTFLLAAQGYYIEWLRGEWLTSQTGTPFTPSDQTLVTAMSRWQAKRGQFEEQFETTRIPTR
jgi:hypothetical protein